MSDLADKYIERFTLNQRLQHGINAVACLSLFLTGLPVKFPDQLGYIAIMMGGFNVTTVIHRMAGTAILALAMFHFLYYIIDRGWFKDKEIIPSPKDVTDVIEDTKFIIGLSDEKGRYRKYSYREKLDYWGAVIFFPILIVTGVILWHPAFAVHYFMPADYLPAVRLIHSMDAILAGMAVMLHMYNVHLSPRFFPVNWTMFTGMISEEMAEEEFPLWYERVKRNQREE
ncbi:MAG: cytochrome b/b6 domain-containing protein [ANME-2 cluster archaeon]|nr:cytochrome b/b6 domain-containing protein [ANME-2 cluster archaeon]